MATALRIFGEAVAAVAGEPATVLDAAEAAGALTEVEAAGEPAEPDAARTGR